jgi:diguanylate cyclase (GGDEF)-like protein
MRVLISDLNLVPLLRRCGCDGVVASGIDGIVAYMGEPKHPEALLLDWSLIAHRPDVIETLQPLTRSDDVYTIVMVPRERSLEAEMAVACLADDIVLAPADRQDLEFRVRSARRLMETRRDLRTVNELCDLVATQDVLTGLLNRHAFEEQLTREMARSFAFKLPLAVVLIRVDGVAGQVDAARDAILAQAARRVHAGVERYNMVGHIAREVFAVMLPHRDAMAARAIASQLQNAIAEKPFAVGNARQHLKATFSIAFPHGTSDVTAAAFLRAAEERLDVEPPDQSMVKVVFPSRPPPSVVSGPWLRAP